MASATKTSDRKRAWRDDKLAKNRAKKVAARIRKQIKEGKRDFSVE